MNIGICLVLLMKGSADKMCGGGAAIVRRGEPKITHLCPPAPRSARLASAAFGHRRLLLRPRSAAAPPPSATAASPGRLPRPPSAPAAAALPGRSVGGPGVSF